MSTQDVTTNTIALGQQSFETPTDFEIAHSLLATEQAIEALNKKTFFAKSIAKAQAIFLEEWGTEGGNIREAAYALLFGTKVYGEYKGARLKSHPKGKCTETCGPHHRKEGFVWINTEEGFYLRKMAHGETLPEVDCFLAGAWSENTSVHIEEEGAWRPKMGILFDQLYFRLPCEGGEDFKIRAWDLVQGPDLDILLTKGAEEYELLQFERQLEWQSKNAAEIKEKAEAEEAAQAKKSAEAAAITRLAEEAATRKRLAKKVFKELNKEICAVEGALKSISGSLMGEPETARALSRESKLFLLRTPDFRGFLGKFWLANFSEENGYTTEEGVEISDVTATMILAVKEFAPEEILEHYDIDAMLQSLVGNDNAEG
jgi:hypothetical protein